MKTLVGGAIAAVIGLLSLVIWRSAFLQLLAGSIPIMLLLGGCLALYLGFDELKDSWQNGNGVVPADAGSGTDVEQFKKENEDLKKEIESLKSK